MYIYKYDHPVLTPLSGVVCDTAFSDRVVADWGLCDVHTNSFRRPWLTDSTIAAHPKTVFFFDERFMAARHEEVWYEKKVPINFLVRKRISNNDFGVARGTVYFRKHGRDLVSKPSSSLKKSWGATIERVGSVFRVFVAFPSVCRPRGTPCSLVMKNIGKSTCNTGNYA